MNGKLKIRALALLVGVLLLGAVAGAAADRAFIRESPAVGSAGRRADAGDRRRNYLEWLAGELDLDEQQRRRVEASVELYREEASALWREMRPRFDALKSRVRSEIRAVLTEEQARAYDALLERERQRHERRERRSGRPDEGEAR